MGIFNRSIPTYTVDTANKLRITTPVEEPESQSTYIDDAFDPVFNKAVRDRLMKEWGNPVSATLAGYYEMLDNSIVGSTKQWGALGSGMGVLGSFGRTMDKGGDFILGTLTEGIKGITGQGVESPFHNIFVKDQDYTGGRLLAAMGNSMAKMAGAPELTEKDFGGLWTIPSIGIELATDPGILGGALTKAGGGVGKLSTSEVLSNIGKSGHSPLADVGQLLSNYDDAMSKIALDVTAPGTRLAITKAKDKLFQMFEHSSGRKLVDTEMDINATPEEKVAAYDEFVHDAEAQTSLRMMDNLETAEAQAIDLKAKKSIDPDVRHDLEKPFIELYSEVASKLNDKDLLDLYKLHNGENVVTSNRVLNMYTKFKAYNAEHRGKLTKSPHLRKAFDRLYNVKNISAEDRDVSKLIADQIPDSVKKLKNIKPRLIDKTITSTKRKLNTTSFNQDVLNTIRSADTETRRAILKRYKLSVKEYEKLVEHEEAFKKSTDALLGKYGNTVAAQNKEVVDSINKTFGDLPNTPVSSTLKYDIKGSQYDEDSDYGILTREEAEDLAYDMYGTELTSEELENIFDSVSGESREDVVKLITTGRASVPDEIYDHVKHAQKEVRSKFKKFVHSHMDEFRAVYNKAVSEGYPHSFAAFIRHKAFKAFKEDLPKLPAEHVTFEDAISVLAPDYIPDTGLETIFYDLEYPLSLKSQFKKYSDAPFTISPSIHRVSNNPEVAVNGVRYAQNTFAKLISDFDNFGVTNRDEFWNFINRNPDLRLALMSEYQRKQFVEKLKTVFETKTGKALDIDFDNDSVMRQVMETVLSDPELYTTLNLKNAYIEGLNDALFGAKDSRTKSYTYQNQFVALDKLTKTLEHVLGDAITERTAVENVYIKFKELLKNPKHLTDAEFIYRPELWYTESLHNALKRGYAKAAQSALESGTAPTLKGIEAVMEFVPDEYTKALNWMQNVGISTLKTSETDALYAWAKRMQDEVFLPVQNKARGDFTSEYKPTGRHIGISKAAASDSSGDAYDTFGVPISESAYADSLGNDTNNITALEAGFSYRNTSNDSFKTVDTISAVDTRVLNEILRANRNEFKSIEDIKKFIKRLNPYFEFKLKPSELLNLNIKGSEVPSAIKRYLSKYKPETKPLSFIKINTPEDKLMLSIQSFITDTDRSNFVTNRYGKTVRGYTAVVNKERLEILKRIARLDGVADAELYTLFRPAGDYTRYDSLVDMYVKEGRKPAVTDEYLTSIGQRIFKDESDLNNFLNYAKHLKRPDETTLNRLGKMFTDVDLAPDFVEPNKLESNRIVGEVLFPKTTNTAKAAADTLDVKKPSKTTAPKATSKEVPKTPSSEVIEEEIVEKMAEVPPETAADMAVSPPKLEDEALRTAASASGVEDVLNSALTLAEEFEVAVKDLPPEAIERLDLLYGKKKVRLFEVLNEAIVKTTNAKYDPKNALQNKLGHVLAHEAKVLRDTDPKAAKRIQLYDAVQTAERGDILHASKLVDEIVTSNGFVGIRFDPHESAHAKALIDSLDDYVTKINNASGYTALKLVVDDGDDGALIRVVLNVDGAYDLLVKRGITVPEFKDTDNIVFEAPRELTDIEKAFKSSEQYKQYDKFLRRQSTYVQDLYRTFGFGYDASEVHIKHVKNTYPDIVNPLTVAMNRGLPKGDKLFEVSRRLLNSDKFKHLYGTFGITPHGRSYRGSVNRWNTDSVTTFDFDPVRIINATFAEGTLTNSEAQSFIGLFVNDNFKLKTYFKTPDELQEVLYKTFEDGSESGNYANLMLVAPVYDESGKVVKFKKFDKTTRAGIEAALNATDAILVPSSLIAPLDIWCKKDAKMSSKIYRFFNTYFALPYKFGVLTNPSFLLGNVSDAYLKQATTLSEVYGTSIAEEFANVATSLREVQYLNNSASRAYSKIIAYLTDVGVSIPAYESPMTALNINPSARKRIVDFLNGKLTFEGKVVPPTDALTDADVDALRVWMYINNFQTTVNLRSGFRDFAKEDLFKDDEDTNIVKRIFYGSGAYNPKKLKTWGLFINNPLFSKIFDTSESMEAYFRSANVLNALKHNGYDRRALSKALGEGFDAEASEKLHIETMNALNAMYNSNFNYDAQSEFMHRISYTVPFPTFFLKNFAYWMELLVNNPEYIDTAITIQEGLWNTRDEEVEEDRFMAEAKGRGAIPISDGDNKGLSKLFKGIYKPTPLNSMFGAFHLLNHPIEDLTNRVHPLINAPMQMLQAEMGQHNMGLATPQDAEDVKYRPYSMNKFERNISYSSNDFNSLEFLFHKLNPYDRAISNVLRLPHKLGSGDAQLSDVVPSVFQPDF